MTAANIIREALDAGVDLTLTAAGTIKVSGDPATINRFAPLIRERKPAIIEALKAANAVMRSCWWRVHFEAADVAIYHRAALTADEARATYPAAIKVEAFEPRPAPPLSAGDERAIRAWLAAIGETDENTIGDVLMQCRFDPEARDYYLRRSAAGWQTDIN